MNTTLLVRDVLLVHCVHRESILLRLFGTNRLLERPRVEVACGLEPEPVVGSIALYEHNQLLFKTICAQFTNDHVAREADVEGYHTLDLLDVLGRKYNAERLDVRVQVLYLTPTDDGEDVRGLLQEVCDCHC